MVEPAPRKPVAPLANIHYLTEPNLAALRDLLDYWQDKRAGRFAPGRADIRPEELRPHLAHLILVDVIANGEDLKYRLIGTALTQAAQRDATGKLFTELYRDVHHELEPLLAVHRQVIAGRAPVFVRANIFWHSHASYRDCESVLLPLSNDGERVDMILGETRPLPITPLGK
jgi:hypothetical protein